MVLGRGVEVESLHWTRVRTSLIDKNKLDRVMERGRETRTEYGQKGAHFKTHRLETPFLSAMERST